MSIYNSSSGPVEIGTMPLSHAKNARNKLVRNEPERTAEIAALEQHIAALEAGAMAENPRAVAGGNNPPPDEPEPKLIPTWTGVQIQMDDLLTEAANWADGTPIANQEQADAVARLRQLLQDAAKLADEARVAEKAPHDKIIDEIQKRYNRYIAPMQNKHPGTVSLAVKALGNTLSVWLNKLAEEKRQREDAARKKAEEAAAAAQEARKALETTTDLVESDEAAALLDAAEDAAKELRAVEREKVQAKGEFRATGLRSTWTGKLIDGQGGTVLSYYAKRYPERVKAFLQTMIDEDVKAGVRSIPGVAITEEKHV